MNRWLKTGMLLAIGVAIVGIVLHGGGEVTHLAAQVPTTPTPVPCPPGCPIPGTAQLPPGGYLNFSDPVPTVPPGATPPLSGGQRMVAITNESDAPATVAFDGRTVTVTTPAGSAVRALRPFGVDCTVVEGQPNVLQCPGNSGVTLSQRASFSFTTTTTAGGASESVALVSGCTNVTLTWPAGTPAERIAGAVTPSSALIAIWRLTNATGTFAGYTPRFPQASDLATVNRLDAAFVCMDAPGSLTRPVI